MFRFRFTKNIIVIIILMLAIVGVPTNLSLSSTVSKENQFNWISLSHFGRFALWSIAIVQMSSLV